MMLPVLPPFRRLQEAFQESARLIEETRPALCRVLSQEHSREADVLELTQVADVVISGQTLLADPAERFTQAALPDPHPRPHRRDGSDVWKEVTDVPALCFIEQVECTVEISFSLPNPRHSDPPAIRVLRQAHVLAQLLALPQTPGSSRQVVALAVELAHPDVHVCGPK
jgi:hypothetical protein